MIEEDRLNRVQLVCSVLIGQVRHELGIGFDSVQEPAMWRIAEAIVSAIEDSDGGG